MDSLELIKCIISLNQSVGTGEAWLRQARAALPDALNGAVVSTR